MGLPQAFQIVRMCVNHRVLNKVLLKCRCRVAFVESLESPPSARLRLFSEKIQGVLFLKAMEAKCRPLTARFGGSHFVLVGCQRSLQVLSCTLVVSRVILREHLKDEVGSFAMLCVGCADLKMIWINPKIIQIILRSTHCQTLFHVPYLSELLCRFLARSSATSQHIYTS
jgi:hypothetical protein